MEPGTKEELKQNNRKIISIVLNIIIMIFAGIGTTIMLFRNAQETALSSSGIENLKYFTVLSNIFCGIVAAVWLIFILINKRFPILLKLMGAAAVGLTFLIIGAFLRPLYPEVNLYEGSNFWFHLIVPVVAMLDFILLETQEKIPFKYTLFSAIWALIYGTLYLINILINGVGEWPDTNDWYGFLNWGYPIGIAIFAAIVLMNWGIACLLRLLNHLIGKLMTAIQGKGDL